MIAHIKGSLQNITDSTVVIDVGGVGFFISVSQRTIQGLKTGQEVLLHTHFQLREDGISLYGFKTEMERQIFQMVIGVSGVGPKVAMNLLSSYTPGELIKVFLERDTGALSHVSGIGKKTAERLIVELSDKAAKIPVEPLDNGQIQNDVSSALELLIELGANRKEALDALEKVRREDVEDPEGTGRAGRAGALSLDELITRSLTFLGGKK